MSLDGLDEMGFTKLTYFKKVTISTAQDGSLSWHIFSKCQENESLAYGKSVNNMMVSLKTYQSP